MLVLCKEFIQCVHHHQVGSTLVVVTFSLLQDYLSYTVIQYCDRHLSGKVIINVIDVQSD